MAFIVREPAFIDIEDLTPSEVEAAKSFLTFHDKSVDFQLRKFKQMTWLQTKDPDAYKQGLEDLKKKQKPCLFFEREDKYQTYAGLADMMVQRFKGHALSNEVEYPEPRGIPWRKKPQHESRYYQDDAKRALIEVRHGAVSMGTGLGKSRIILELCQYFGLKTIVMAPSISIASQLYDDFVEALGERYVGMMGDGKKKYDRLITIGVCNSLAKVDESHEAWDSLSKAQLFIADESHQTPADTLERVCMKLAARAPYRFFFSATQVRNDGAELVLKGIIGPIVYNMTVREGVDQGFLAEPVTTVFKVRSPSTTITDDAQLMTRIHLFQNPNVLRLYASIANNAVSKLNQKVLVLVDEVEQFSRLLPLLNHEARFAHGPLTNCKGKHNGYSKCTGNKCKVPEQYWEADSKGLVKAFNNEEFPILVGTSCIGTGTDVKAVETLIEWQGGCSPIAIPQGVGRGTRLYTFLDDHKKTKCNVADAIPLVVNDSEGIDDTSERMQDWSLVKRHAMARVRMYNDIYPNVQVIACR